MIKTASICLWLAGLGFGLPCLYGIRSVLNGKGIAYVLGFPAYGNGPFEKMGIPTSLPLLAGFLLVCALECVAGWGLWNHNKGSALLSFAIIPVEMLFYIGFALPFGPPVLILRLVMLYLGWAFLH